MRILVDHGDSGNLGDTAMLETVVDRLLRSSDAVEPHVIYRPSMKTRLWGAPRVEPVDFRIDYPSPTKWPFWRTRLLWRLSNTFAATWSRYCFASLGRHLQPAEIGIGGDRTGVSLEDWCRDYDGYLVVGGGNLTDAFPWELWRRCCLIHAFAAQGKPVVLSGQQIGPFRSGVMSRALGRALRKADFVGLREPTGSVDFCKRAGLSSDRYAVMGDDSFGIEAEAPSRVEALLGRIGLSGSGFLAVNIRIADYSGIHRDHLQEVADLVSALSKRCGLPVLVVPIALNDTDSDIHAGHRLAEAVGDGRVRVLDDPGLTPALVKGVLARAYGAVGVSYHFCTFALSQGVPAVCIHHGDYYGQKGRGLCQFWGCQKLSLPLGRLTTDQALAQICEVIDDEGFREVLRSHALSVVRRWKTMFDSRVYSALPGPVSPSPLVVSGSDNLMGTSFVEERKCD